jgi:parallel beta-helix repeat protein
MKSNKVMLLVFLITVSLCVVNTQPVKSQSSGVIYIYSDGSVAASTNATVPIERDGNVYTLTDNINNYVIVVQRDNIILDGAGYALGAQGDLGIDLSYRNNVTVKNLQVGFALYGIYLWNATGNTITGNTLTYNGYGIYVIAASQNSIIGNTATNNDIGINVESSTNNILRDNVLNNDHNLAVYGSEAQHFDNDIDDSNTANGKKIYYLISQSNLLIDPTTYPEVGYLALVNCQNITVSNMELTNNGHGILLAYTTGSTITQNTIEDNYGGIGLFASTGNFIFGNNIMNNYRGIQLSNSSNTNSISTNNVTDNTEGMFIFSSFQNTIFGNNITDNDIGIGFKEASNNMIRGNYFIDNTNQVYDPAVSDASLTMSINMWDFSYPVGGNYWSDYTGVDIMSGAGQNQTGSDGIGDTPYIINDQNEDKYPLMPYGSPPAVSVTSPQNKTYTTTDVPLEFTVSDTTTSTKYSLDGQANVTITDNTTLSGLAEGTHSVTVYVQDADGRTGTSGTIYFTVSLGAEPTTQTEEFPLTWIAAIIAAIIVVVVVLFYFLRRNK